MSRDETDGVINRVVRAQVDSLARAAMEELTERLLNSMETKESTVVLFDTDKILDDGTGLLPVKAVARQKVVREEVERTDTQKRVLCETERKVETADNCVEKITTAVEVEQKASWWDMFKVRIMYILLIPGLIVALWTMYKLFKLLK